MTIDGNTICSIIQSFPVLLILAQNSNKCLHTPFNYKPPHPTHSPEYYEAYDALLQTLLNDCHGYQYGVPSYGHGYNKCHNHYPVYNFPADGHYPVYGQGHSNHDFGYQYPSFEGHYISKNGFNKTSYVYNRNYAPNQVHNVKRKYKVVVKGSKRLQKLRLREETCTTVDGGIGTCVSIVKCAPYVTLLQQAQTNPAAVQQLRAAHCGFEGNNPKVCCPLPAPPTAPPTETPSGKSLPNSDFIAAFPEPPVCGLSNASFSRVVGGVNAKLGDFPWMALLGYHGRRGASTRWLCGGSLISSHHVLSAAHCIHGHEDDLYLVRLGELDLASDDEGATPIDILIKNKIKHEKYNSTSFTNDIGLLVLERDVEFTDLIRPICIPTRADLRANSFVDYNPLIAGWGDTEFRGPSASHLQALQLPVLDNSYCVKAYSRYSAQVIDDRVMCAGFKKGGKDACQGDSGGPLMQPDYNPVKFTTYFYQTGVVSFGRKCAEAGFPGIYTRVTYFVPWLQKNVLGLAE